MSGKQIYTKCKTGRIQDQPQSNSAAGLRSNLFATQFIIPQQKQAEFQSF